MPSILHHPTLPPIALGILVTPILSQARHLTQLRTLSDPPGGLGQGQDPSSRGRGRNHDHEETTDDELGTNIVSPPPLTWVLPLNLHDFAPSHFVRLHSTSLFLASPQPRSSPASSLVPMPQPSEQQEGG